MKRPIHFLALVLISWPSLSGQDVPYRTGTWDGDRLGNHRAVVRVDAAAAAVRAVLPWRRRDAEPGKKAVLVFDAATGARIRNARTISSDREKGEVVFEPATVPGEYHVYFMPYALAGSRNYPTARYLEPEETAEAPWLARAGLAGTPAEAAKAAAAMPSAAVVEFQAIDEFNSFWPMDVIATAEETRRLAEAHPGEAFLLFPEDRTFSIRMTDDLPLRWIRTGPRPDFTGEASRGEFYAFQIGVWAMGRDLDEIRVAFTDLESPGGGTIPATALRCINTGGRNWDGLPFEKTVSVPLGKIQALWCGVAVPADAAPGIYSGSATVRADGLPAKSVRLTLGVTEDILEDGGDGDPFRLSRLRWLDSDLAMDDEPVKPFTPLTVNGRTIACLGRTVDLGEDGFPARIRSFFSSGNTGIGKTGRDILARPMSLVVETADDAASAGAVREMTFTGRSAGRVTWAFAGEAGPVRMDVRAAMEMDGYLEYKVRISAAAPVAVKDIRLEIPVAREAARYMMGLGRPGGLRPAAFDWTWDQKNNQDSLWIGDVNAGFQVGLRAENYSRPLNTNFYLSKPLNLPPSWWNGGKGTVAVRETPGGEVLVIASGGERTLAPGEDLHFNFILLLTPFKTIDTDAQWATRFFHSYKPIAEAAQTGANTLNIHHANDINPYINYPFLRLPEMKAYIDEAHAQGLRVKIYNTIRELSNRAPEIHALRSLGHEIFSPGPGGGYSWLQEHLGSDYIAAWFVPDLKDAAVINSGMSRWHNAYIEGLNWLAGNVGIDGLYLDDVAFDRTTMKRVRKVLDRNRPNALIDLHSANQFNPRDGFVSSATLYLEHFPYLDRLWFGEYFDYPGAPPDYWLVEVSGIPFGLMGEMLQGGGNPWRGMVFGMTNRLPWSGSDPSRFWRLWDAFGMKGAEMIGWWEERCPVKPDLPDIRATVYRKKGATLLSLASWAKGPVQARLTIDWKALGLDPARVRIRAPEIPDFQFGTVFAPGDRVPFEPGKGWILILEDTGGRRPPR